MKMATFVPVSNYASGEPKDPERVVDPSYILYIIIAL
tara:strand:- start:346 stop:456 length:111 start_codon:yes stop_codon:yes gene_type:complete